MADIRGDDIRQCFGQGESTCGGRINDRHRRALSYRHGFTGVAKKIPGRYRDIADRHLPGPDQLIAGHEAAYGSITNVNQERLIRNCRHCQHAVYRLAYFDPAQFQGSGLRGPAGKAHGCA